MNQLLDITYLKLYQYFKYSWVSLGELQENIPVGLYWHTFLFIFCGQQWNNLHGEQFFMYRYTKSPFSHLAFLEWASDNST